MTTIALKHNPVLPHFSRTSSVGDSPQPARDVKSNGVMPTIENIAENKNVFVNQVAQRTAASVSLADDTLRPAIQPPTVELDSTQLQQQMKHVVFTGGPQQQAAEPLTQAKNSEFSIVNMHESRAFQMDKIIELLASSALKEREAEGKMAVKLQGVSINLANNSADHTRQAGQAAASQAVVSSAIGLVGSGVGLRKAGQSYTQGKLGISQQRNSLDFQQQAKSLQSGLHQTSVRSSMAPGQLDADRSVISGGTALPMEHKGQLAGIQAGVHQNSAAKLTTQATASTQIGNMGGQIAASPFQAEQANETANATLTDADKQVTDNSRSKVDERKQMTWQMLQQIIATLSQTTAKQMDTAGALASIRA
ncbi:hypothetical protein [Serratia liquefaciens]|uniref:hypothetical protein n=1 Tax=Serratia liquefaciens TaxID=614 RepID=UPI002157AD67|nr:hypothetical protein [Serratia liquefaciens]